MLGMNVILIFEIILIELFLLKSWKVTLNIEPRSMCIETKRKCDDNFFLGFTLCLTFNNIIMYSPF